MSRLANLLVLFVLLIGLGLWGGDATAAICTSTAAGGNWNLTTTWTGCAGGGGTPVNTPGTADTAIIATAGIGAVAVNVASRVNVLTINAGATLNASTVRLRVNTTTSVSGAINFTGAVNAAHRFSGAVTINAGGAWTDTSSSTFSFRAGGITNNGGTFSAGTGVYEIRSVAQTIGGTSPISIPSLLATTTITNTGVLTVGTALTGTTLINNSATAILNLGGTSAITTLTATFAGNTVNYTGAAQTVNAVAYSNLGLSGSGAKTLTGVTTVAGNLTTSGTATATTAAALAIGGNLGVGAGTTLTVGAFNMGVTGTTTVSGILAHSSATGTKNFTGAVTINAGGSLTNAGNAAITYAGGLVNNGSFASGTAAQTFTSGGITHNGTAFTAGSGAFTFSANPQAINCATALTIPSITTAIVLTNNCNLTVTTALAGAGSFINAATGQLHVNFTGAMGITTFTATAVGNVVDYNFAGVQTVKATPYYNLSLSTSGAKTMAATTINGNFTMSGTATTAPTGALAVGGNFTIGTGTTFTAGAFNHTVGGNWNETGTFNPGTGTVTLNGATAQTISGTSPVNFNNLAVSAVSPNITLATNVTVVTVTTGTVTLTPSCPDFTLSSTTPAQTLHSCPPPPASFNCVESGASPSTGHIYTKLAGTGFSFDVVALKADGTVETTYASTSNKNVTVELVDGSGATACGSRSAITPAVSQTLTFTSADLGRKPAASMTVGKAYANLRCRVTDATGTPIVGCSTDNFSVRPVSLTLTATGLGADATGVSTTATPVVKAGANFTLTATASDTGYTGMPTIDLTALAAHSGAVRAGTLTGTFAAAASGVVSSTFTYDEVGYFMLNANGLLDTTFTAVDNAVGDCTADFSTLSVGGQYGCKIGSAVTSYFGRFIPDHFAITPGAVTPANNGFTYLGQDGFATAFTLTAQNATNVTTQNYSGAFAKLGLTTWSNFGFSATGLPVGAALSASATAPTGTWSNGATTVLTAKHQVSRPANPAAISSVTISALPVDADGVTLPAAVAMNAIPTPLYFGQIKLSNAYGSELLPLQITATVQYCNAVIGTSCSDWRTNSADTLTTLASPYLNMSNPNPAGFAVTIGAPGSIVNGQIKLNLSSTAKVKGSVNVTAQSPVWLPSNTAQATFGVYKGRKEFIYMRENY